MAEHNPRCAIFREPPGLRSDDDCNCEAVPSLLPPEGKPEAVSTREALRSELLIQADAEITRLRASLAEAEAQLAECREFGREALRDAKQERDESRAGLAEAEALAAEQRRMRITAEALADKFVRLAEDRYQLQRDAEARAEELKREHIKTLELFAAERGKNMRLRRAGEELAEKARAAVEAAPGYTAKHGSIWKLDHALDDLRSELEAWRSAAPGKEEDG